MKYVVLAFTEEGHLVDAKPAQSWSEAVDIEYRFALWDYFTVILDERDIKRVCKAAGVEA